MTTRASIWRETFKALRETASVWWPWVVIFGIIYGVITGMIPSPVIEQHTPAELKQHPELALLVMQNFRHIGWYLGLLCLGLIPAYAIASYGFTVLYLRQVVKTNPPEFSLNGFFFWLGQIIKKWFFCSVWLLLPIIGFYFYVRNSLRYILVSPLALLRHEPVLENSKKLTAENLWRIFWNRVALAFVLGVWMLLSVLIPILVLTFIAHGNETSPLLMFGKALFQGLWSSLFLMSGMIFSCTTHRILLQERREAMSEPMPNSNNPMIQG